MEWWWWCVVLAYFSIVLHSTEPLQNFIMSFHSEDPQVVAVAQMTSTSDKDKNFCTFKDLVTAAKKMGAKMIFFPEASDYVTDNSTEAIKLAEQVDGPLLSKYKTVARENQVWISIGVHLKFSDAKVSNTHIIIDDDGGIVGKYDKLHTYDVDLPNQSFKESSYVERGKKIVPPIPTPVGNVGLSVCYDLRFPEVGVALTQMGADILTYPSAFTFETGAVHWETLLRARAIENQCYVIGAAQTDFNAPTRRTWGHSMIVDPMGTIIAQCTFGESIAIATIHSKLLKKTRLSMPLQSQRRLDIYPKLASHSIPTTVDSYQFGQVTINAKTVFYRTNYSIAFVNKRCAVPGHVLVTPIRVVKRFSELEAFELGDLFQTVQKVESRMEKVHNTSSSTIVVQDGPDAGQTILHVHVHILPRKPNDFPDNDDVYRILQKHAEEKWREEEEMIAEAEYLKQFFSE